MEDEKTTQSTADDLFSELLDNEDLIDSDDSETTEAAAETGTPTEEPAKAEEKPTSETRTIKYNGKELEVPIDELITLAQKGMNYDKVASERDLLKNDSSLKLIEKLASDAGMSKEDYVKHVDETNKQAAASSMASESNIPPAIALEILELRDYKNKTMSKVQQTEALAKIYQNYPNVNELPQEVLEAIAAGEEPLSAYKDYDHKMTKAELEKYKTELEMLKNNNKNKDKAMPSAQGDAGLAPTDDFISGLFG